MIKKIGTWIKEIIKWGFILWLMFDLIAGGARIVLFNNFYNVGQKMTYLYKNCNCGLPQSNYDLIEKNGGSSEEYEDTFWYSYTIKVNSSRYLYVMSDTPKNAGGWEVIDKRKHQDYFYDIEQKDYETESGKKVSLSKDKDIKRQLNLTLNKIGKKMNYQFKLF